MLPSTSLVALASKDSQGRNPHHDWDIKDAAILQQHSITAITREDSKSALPEGVASAKVDYENHQSLVEALKGHDAFIITLSVWATPGTQSKLLKAAADANVPWVLPNEWSPDTADEGLTSDVRSFSPMPKARAEIAQLGKSSYIAVTTGEYERFDSGVISSGTLSDHRSSGFWYEWSLAIAPSFGFNFAEKSITFFDEGETPISTSTWPQVGRAIAALLSLPINAGKGACLEDYKNKQIYVKSFTISQQDMFKSVQRVTKTGPSDWTITKEPVKERYTNGMEAMKNGDRIGFAKMMYSRVFYPDGVGNFEKRRGVLNELLALPEENIDEATERTIERSKKPMFG